MLPKQLCKRKAHPLLSHSEIKQKLHLAIVAGKQREDLWVDEVELGLNLVAAELVHRTAILVEYQVLSTGSKSGGIRKTKHTALVGLNLRLLLEFVNEEGRFD